MRERTVHLFDKADSSIQAARVLLSAGELEFIPSHAYYAMFYSAEALLEESDLSFGRHSAVHSAFGREFVKPGKLDQKYHKWLLDAFDKRIVSDYEVNCEISKEDAEDLLAKAVEFVDVVKTYLKK